MGGAVKQVAVELETKTARKQDTMSKASDKRDAKIAKELAAAQLVTVAVVPALAALPKMPKAARKPKALVPCGCGCGGTTTRSFAPGHDSRLKGWVLRVERGVVKLADIPDGERQAVKAAIAAKASATKAA